MRRSNDTQKRIVHRLKIANGHLAKVVKMTEDQEYCVDIIHQSQAVQKALRQIDSLLLESHLQTCVADKVKKNKTKEAMKEVMDVFKKGY